MSEIINIVLADGASAPTKPVDISGAGSGSERMTRQMKVSGVMSGANGEMEGYAVSLPNPQGDMPPATSDGLVDCTEAEEHQASETANQTEFQTAIDYAAFTNYNWIARKVDEKGELQVVEHGATADNDHFQVSNVGGKAKITFGATVNRGQLVQIFKCTPRKVFDIADGIPKKVTGGGHLAWALPVDSGGFNGAVLSIEPIV